jgi:hypothetical protein
MNAKSVLSLLGVTCMLMVALAAGCGGDTGRARDYIRQGDEVISAIESQGKELAGIVNQAFDDVYSNISSGKPPDLKEFKVAVAEAEEIADEMTRRARRARSTFAKVDKLEDVPGYVKYADLKTQLIDQNIQGLEDLKGFLVEASEMLAADDFDLMSFQSFVTQYGEAVKKLGDEGGKIQQQAEALKKSEKL